MSKFRKWMHPGLKLKRWILLLVLSSAILAFGLSGLMGQTFRGFRVDVVEPRLVERLAKQVQSLRFNDFVLLGFGIWGIFFAIRRLFFSLATVLSPHRGEALESVVLQRARLKRGPKVVAIGGGTGLPHLLSGLKKFTLNLTAVVTVADDGGSSGRLRKDLAILPPGDIRNCLVALAEAEPLMQKLFQHRFTGSSSLSGHSFGNLFIAALSAVSGDFGQAIKESSRVLAITGKVLPISLDALTLLAEFEDGRCVCGESAITKARGKIRRIWLEPSSAFPNPEALEAIQRADAVVLGPGSLFTSILPNMLLPGVTAALRAARGLKIYICNIMTQPGETDSFTVSDHLRALEAHGGCLPDYCVINTEEPLEKVLHRYRSEGQEKVEVDKERIHALGVRLVKAKLLERGGVFVRHDPERLARSVMRLIII